LNFLPGANNLQSLREKKLGSKTPEGRARIAAAARESALNRWVDLRRSGERTRLGELSDEELAALRAARTGKKASPKTKARISAVSKARELNQRIRRLMDPYRWT